MVTTYQRITEIFQGPEFDGRRTYCLLVPLGEEEARRLEKALEQGFEATVTISVNVPTQRPTYLPRR